MPRHTRGSDGTDDHPDRVADGEDARDASTDRPGPGSRVVLSEARALRAIAHPIRLNLVGLLRRHGPLTATEAGRLLGESSGTTSFHLRQLARYGLVEEAGGGTGRQKPWRATAQYTGLPDVAGTPAMAEVSMQVRGVLAARYHELVRDWIGRAPGEPEEWQRAASFSDYSVHVTADELAELGQRIDELLSEITERRTDPGTRPPGARLVRYLNLSMPAPDEPTLP